MVYYLGNGGGAEKRLRCCFWADVGGLFAECAVAGEKSCGLCGDETDDDDHDHDDEQIKGCEAHRISIGGQCHGVA